MDGAADVVETIYVPFQDEPDAAPVRLWVRGCSPRPFPTWTLFARPMGYHGCITDREGETLELAPTIAATAEIENPLLAETWQVPARVLMAPRGASPPTEPLAGGAH